MVEIGSVEGPVLLVQLFVTNEILLLTCHICCRDKAVYGVDYDVGQGAPRPDELEKAE